MDARVKTGLEVFVDKIPIWARGRKAALLCHQASVDKDLCHSRERLSQILGKDLVCLFSPQHGLFAEKQDNMVESSDEIDPDTGLPVYSLYGSTREPKQAHLSGIDLFIIDLQDVGCRVYTYVWTMLLVMRACARHGKAVAILDRPNPIGGLQVEGNILSKDQYSFVGMAPIPMRHGMTIGELALLLKEVEGLDLELHVVPMKGWERWMYFDQTGLPWVWPSPNMPALDTAIVYPGQVVLEGTNLSEGRGTTRPFEVFGAPYIDSIWLKAKLEGLGLTGVVFRPQYFEPTFNKWQGQRCKGFQIHVTDRLGFRPYLTTLLLLSLIIVHHKDRFEWKAPPYEYEHERLPADLIIGDSSLRQAVEWGIGPEELFSMFEKDQKDFLELRQPYLLYDIG